MTASRTMEIFLRVRLGAHYDAAQWGPYVASVLDVIGLGAAVAGSKPYAAFSGGMKRKLAVAVAMYTGCRVGVLDEPSTGMDPHARRALWRTIEAAVTEGAAAASPVVEGTVVDVPELSKMPAQQPSAHNKNSGNGRAVLVTTHSMEEAQAVCTRISIVSAGGVRCTGSVLTLQERFDAGYTLAVEFEEAFEPDTSAATGATPSSNQTKAEKEAEIARTVAAMEAAGADAPFPGGCRCVDSAAGTYTFALGALRGGATGSLSAALATVERNKSVWRIARYSVTQRAALDQIFLQVAGSSDARATM
jgi:ABC-type multidrug transport system ATPase subunit